MRRATGSLPIVVLALGLAGAAAPVAADVPIQTRVLRSTFSLGESTTLEVDVRGNASADPEFTMPAGLEILGSGRMQNFAWVNGRSNVETIFRYELGGSQAGRYSLGPFRVRMGAQTLVAPAIPITVMAAATRISGGANGPAALIADVEPRAPYVGQPVILRVRLVQRAQLAEDPQYVPPATPGFWSEPASRPESYYAAEGNERVLVTETKTRLYPLATGTQTIGEAAAHLALFKPGSDDPSSWIGGRVPRQELLVRSSPIRIQVRPLPAHAPPGFDGAVGVLSTRWSADRAHTSRDVPVTVRLEVRGIGNLPLIHTPRLEGADFEVFAAATDDSLAAPGQAAPGRRTFQWTLLPRREGRLSIPPPAFAWFDPAQPQYRSIALEPLTLDVGPALNPAGGWSTTFPPVFLEHPVTPFARHSQPWAYAVAGLMLGGSIALLRAASRPASDAPERARQRERLRAIGLASGPDFWQAADEASAWLESRGGSVRALRESIAAARYGGAAPDAAKLRRALIEQLSKLLPAARATLPMRVAAAALGLAAIVLVVLFSGGTTDLGTSRAREMVQADAAARIGDVDRARSAWRALWKEGAREAGLAARLAWGEIRTGSVGPAATWVLAGEIDDPRDPSLEWVRQRVQEAGGLIGSGGARLPVRRLEWALAALTFGALVGFAWPRRVVSAALVVLAVGAAAVFPAQTVALRRADRAVVRAPVGLEATGIELETGQVVRILERRGARVRIAAGRGVVAWVPASALYAVEDLR